MKPEVKVVYEFTKAMHIALKTKGVQADPMYFDFCLKVALGKSQDCDHDGDDVVAYFIRQLAGTSVALRAGGPVTWMDIPLVMINPTLTDVMKIEAIDHVIRYLTGRSRSSWVNEYEAAEQERFGEPQVTASYQPEANV